MPPPPPPPPPAPPTFSLANTEKPLLNRSEQGGRNALLSDICKQKKLKKAVTNDRSAPIVSAPKGPGGGGGGSAGLGGLFAGGMPKLRSAGNRESSDSGGSRPPIMPPGGRSSGPRPFAINNTPPKMSGSSLFPRNNNPEPPRNKLQPPNQPKFSRPDIGSKPDLGPPPLPNAPRPSASSMQTRGPPPVPGNRMSNPGPSPPNRNQGSPRQFSATIPPSSANRSFLPPTPSRLAEDKPSPPNPPLPNSNRPPLPPTPVRMTDDRPLPPPMTNRPPLNRDGPPLPPPQHQKPPVPQTPRPTPSFQAPPPPPPNRPGPLPTHPSAAPDIEIPKLPQRNLSLHSTSSSASPGSVRSGPLPPSERPPPPVRDPPSRSGPLPPPPPASRNGSIQKAPPVPQPPNRMGSDTRSGFRPPLPPDRGSPVAPPPPPTSMRNGFQESSQSMCEDEWEGRFSFHSISELPPPEPYVNFPKTYPSKQNKTESRDSGRRERGAPPLPPIPPIPR